jgi:hypothetical protein
MAGAAALLKLGGKAGGKDTLKSGVSLATGLLQSIQANKLKKEAESLSPDLTDPGQMGFLAELNQKRKSIEAGAEYNAAMQEADASQATASDAIVNASGGDVSGTIQGLLQSQGVAGRQKNAAIGQGQQKQLAYDTAYGRLLDDVTARKLELQLLAKNQKMAEWAKKKQFASQNVMAGIGGLLGGKKPGAAPEMGTATSVTPPLNTGIPTGPVTPAQPDAMNMGTPIQTTGSTPMTNMADFLRYSLPSYANPNG